MKITRIEVSSNYRKSFRKIPSIVQSKSITKTKIFETDPFNPVLRTHPLAGKDKNCWAFWVDFHYRIKFVFLSNEEVLFLDIGSHDIYK